MFQPPPSRSHHSPVIRLECRVVDERCFERQLNAILFQRHQSTATASSNKTRSECVNYQTTGTSHLHRNKNWRFIFVLIFHIFRLLLLLLLLSFFPKVIASIHWVRMTCRIDCDERSMHTPARSKIQSTRIMHSSIKLMLESYKRRVVHLFAC